MNNIGQRNRRITYYEEGTAVSDGIGGYSVTIGDAVETWCSARPMDMSEALRYGLEDGSQSYKFGFNYYQGRNIFQGSTLNYEGSEFRVKSVLEIDEAKNHVVVIATKKV